MRARLLNAAALAAALTLPLVTIAFVPLYATARCHTEPGGPPCADVMPDTDELLWQAAVAAAVVELLIVGGRAGWLALHNPEARLRPALVVALAVIALAVGPVAAGAEAPEFLGGDDLPGLALVSLLLPLVLTAVHRIGERRAAIAVLAALLPSCLFFPFWEGWELTTGYPVLLWTLTLPIALVNWSQRPDLPRFAAAD